MLWRGSDNRYLEGLIHPITGKIDLDRMQARWPSDFRGILTSSAVHYFTPQKAVALKYAGFARKRSGSSPTSVVRMEIANSILEKYKPVLIEHDASDMWRIIIWHSRTRRRIPRPYSHLNNAPVLIGPICRSENSAIEKLDSWNKVSDEHIFMVEEEIWNDTEKLYETKNRRGVQYAFSGLDIQLELEANCKMELQPCKLVIDQSPRRLVSCINKMEDVLALGIP